MRKTWLRLAMPSLSSIALATPHSVQQAQPCEITWVSLLLAMATAAVMRPFRMERLPARCLVLLLLLPTATTEAMAAYVTPHRRFDLISGLFVCLCAGFVCRVLLACLSLPSRERRLPRAFDVAYPGLTALARVELALLWFGLFRWRQNPTDRPSQAAVFPATASGIESAKCWLMVSGLVIEAPLFHILVAHVWNTAAAWVSTGLHSLLSLYLIGYAKSLSLRPTLLFSDRLEIRLGAVAQRIIPRSDVKQLAPYDGRRTGRGVGQRMFGFDEPNLCLTTADSNILFRVDEPARLIIALA